MPPSDMSENQRLWADVAELDARQHGLNRNGHTPLSGLNGNGASNGHSASSADPEKLFALSALRDAIQSNGQASASATEAARHRLLAEISANTQPERISTMKPARLPFFQRLTLRTAVVLALIIITAAAAIAVAASMIIHSAQSCQASPSAQAVISPADPHTTACDFKTMKDDDRPATPAKQPLK